MIQIVQAVSYVKNLFIDCLFYSALSLKVLLGLDFSFHNDEQKYKKHYSVHINYRKYQNKNYWYMFSCTLHCNLFHLDLMHYIYLYMLVKNLNDMCCVREFNRDAEFWVYTAVRYVLCGLRRIGSLSYIFALILETRVTMLLL